MLSVLLVDDEPPARRRLRTLLLDEPDVAVVGEAGTAAEAVAAVRSSRPDLVLLDVRMPEGDGFSVLDALDGHTRPAVIIVSAFGEHALRAFDWQVVDYLTKPFARERFALALRRAREHVEQARSTGPHAEAVQAGPADHPPLRRLPVDLGSRVILLDPVEVDYLRAEGNYVRVHAGTRSYLIRDTLTRLAGRLEPAGFLRVHRSLVVRLDRVREVATLPHGELLLRLDGDTALASGRLYRDRVRGALGLSG
jgi:two-component system LytT family response regulator